jgi:integrase/recombinase XerD
MKKNDKSLTTSFNYELERKFREASEKKQGIDDFIREFMDRYLSKATKRAYAQDLKFFFDFLRSGRVVITSPGELQAFHFQLYRDHLRERGLASATINRRLVAIRSFMKWAVAAKLASHNPLDTIKLPKVQTESPTVAFDDDEALRMINAPDTREFRGRVHRLILVLLFNLGLRRSELTGIKLLSFVEDRGHQVLRVQGKGDKIRTIPLSSRVQGEIADYLAFLRETHGIELAFDDYLLQSSFRERNKGPMDGATVWRVIERYTKELGIEKSVSPHSCRATVISHLLDTRLVPIRDVATFAGHSNITTTERYDKRRNNLDKSAAYLVDYEDDAI